MIDAMKLDPRTAKGIPDPTSPSGEVFLFEEALGQEGRPFVLRVEDPPNKTRPRHFHHEDVLYVYTRGEHHIEGEGTYRAGDVRWTRKGHAYGPETTGPEGGSWWVISYGDPVPVEASDDAAQPVHRAEARPELPHFAKPYDWPAIDCAVRESGGAILEGLLAPSETERLDAEIDAYLEHHAEGALPESGSDVYDLFLGHKTLRLHGLLEKVPSTAGLIGRPELIAWAERLMAPIASSVLLNAGELIQIQPGEPAQYLHRDSDSWPIPVGGDPFIVNAIVALDDCTLENGATYVAPGSHAWEPGRRAQAGELARAVMQRGDAVLFRGDVVHGGGENVSRGRRRALSISYCAGWLRPVENGLLNVSRETARQLPAEVSALLGYRAHDGSASRGGLVGLYENGDPARALEPSVRS